MHVLTVMQDLHNHVVFGVTLKGAQTVKPNLSVPEKKSLPPNPCSNVRSIRKEGLV